MSYELKLFNASEIAAKQMVLCCLSHDLYHLSHFAKFGVKSQRWEPVVSGSNLLIQDLDLVFTPSVFHPKYLPLSC